MTVVVRTPDRFAGLRREIGSWSFTLRLGPGLITVIILMAVLALWVAPFDPELQDFDAIMVPPDLTHLFGTVNLGRDIFSRVIYGARLDLTAGFIMTCVPMDYGVLIGAYAGYRGGWVDTVVGSVTNMAIAFPFLVMIIVVVAVIGPGIIAIFVAVFLLAWTMYARLARAEMIVERAKDYMPAVRVLGYPTRTIVLRHGLPNTIASSVVFSTSNFVLNILLLSGLSFIGLGIQPPTPDAEPDRGWSGAASLHTARGHGMTDHLLEIEDLTVAFGKVLANDGVSLNLSPGETLGIVGESGSGKSVLCRAILGVAKGQVTARRIAFDGRNMSDMVSLIRPTGGRIAVAGKDLASLSRQDALSLPGAVKMVFQDPYGALNPRFSIERTLAEVLTFHKIVPQAGIAAEVRRLMAIVGLSPSLAAMLPRHLSGGQRQRVGLARALALPFGVGAG